MDTAMLLLGAALGAALIFVADRRDVRSSDRIYGVGLIVAALIYVGFAVGRGGGDWITTELGGALVFTGIAVGGIRHFRYMLALGWALHVGWDSLLHTGLDTDFVPTWYVPLCIGFDLVVAGGIFKSALPRRDPAVE